VCERAGEQFPVNEIDFAQEMLDPTAYGLFLAAVNLEHARRQHRRERERDE
jgi:hypothetical protein